jgi:hypothetical protein
LSFSTGYSLYQQSQILSKVRDVATKEDMMEGMGGRESREEQKLE